MRKKINILFIFTVLLIISIVSCKDEKKADESTKASKFSGDKYFKEKFKDPEIKQLFIKG